MASRLKILPAVIVGLLVILLGAGLWILDRPAQPSQESLNCAADPTPLCLLERAEVAARDIDDDEARHAAKDSIVRGYQRAGLPDKALDILRRPGNHRLRATYLNNEPSPREQLFDRLQKANDKQYARDALKSLDKELGRLDPKTLFYLARRWVEVGEIERVFEFIDRALFVEQGEHRACVSRRAASMFEYPSPCRRDTQAAIELGSVTAALYLAGYREEGEKVLALQQTDHFKIVALVDTVEQGIAKSDYILAEWALSRALDLARNLPKDEARTYHLEKIFNHARTLRLTHIADAALDEYRFAATRRAKSEVDSQPLINLARIEAKIGNRERARSALRKALAIAVRESRTPRSLPNSLAFNLLMSLRGGRRHPQRPEVLPTNPRRQALSSVTSQMGYRGFIEDQREALALYAAEVEKLEQPLHRARALVSLAGYTRRHDEAAALAYLSEAKSLVDSWPDRALRRRMLEELASTLISDFGLQAAEAFLGGALPQKTMDRHWKGRGQEAISKGDHTRALDLAEKIRSPFVRFKVALEVRHLFERLERSRLLLDIEKPLRNRASDMTAAAVLDAYSEKDAAKSVEHLVDMAFHVAFLRERSKKTPR